MFKNILKIVLILLMSIGSVNLYAEDGEVAMTKVAVDAYLNNIGKPTTETLVDNLTELLGDINDPSIVEGLEVLAIKELTKVMMGLGTTLGVALTEYSVQKTLNEVLKATLISSSKKGFKSFTKGIVVDIILDVAKQSIEKIVYKEAIKSMSDLQSRIASGVAVMLIEQSILLTVHGGKPYAILVAEAELVYTRYYGIATTLYEVDQIQNQTAKNSFGSDLLNIQVQSTKKFSKSDDYIPSSTLLLEIFNKIDGNASKYESEVDVSNMVTDFKQKIEKQLIFHKTSYRYLYLDRLRSGENERLYFEYLNDYFQNGERIYFKEKYLSIISPYSDIDVNSDLHLKLYQLSNIFDVNYDVSNLSNVNQLSPSQLVNIQEFLEWLDILLRKVSNLDKKTYTYTEYYSIIENKETQLKDTNFALIVDSFYKEIYGENYYKCLFKARDLSTIRLFVNMKNFNYLMEADRNALYRYYTVSDEKDFNYLKIPELTFSFTRKELIDFGYKFLFEHQKNKNLIASCKE